MKTDNFNFTIFMQSDDVCACAQFASATKNLIDMILCGAVIITLMLYEWKFVEQKQKNEYHKNIHLHIKYIFIISYWKSLSEIVSATTIKYKNDGISRVHKNHMHEFDLSKLALFSVWRLAIRRCFFLILICRSLPAVLL